MMASYCIPKSSCSTHRSSWINGDHPTSLYATVTTTVCMHWDSDCCAVSYSVDITRCDGYYVYKLQKPTGCYERYCGVLGEYSKKYLYDKSLMTVFVLTTCKKIYPPCYKVKSFPSLSYGQHHLKDNLSFYGTSICMFELLSFPRIIAGGDYFFFRTKRGR